MTFKEGWGAVREYEEQEKIHFAKIFGTEPNKFLILNSAPVVYEGHFTRNNIVPCEGKSCKMCESGIGKQIRYAFGVYEYRTGWRCVLELSHKQAEVIFNNYLLGDDSRFLYLEIARSGASKKSNLVITTARYLNCANLKKYRPVDVQGFLSRCWEMQSNVLRARAEPVCVPETERPAQRPSDRFWALRGDEDSED